MPAVQNSYAAAYAPGFPGMVANGETSNRLSRTVEDVSGLGFGRAAFRGVGDHGVTGTPSATAGAFMGITIADPTVTPVPGGTAADVYPQFASAGILNDGVIWVTAGSNTTDGAPAYVTSGGAFSASSTSNSAIPAVFDDTVASGALVRLRVRRG